jgi:hypothetical protein
LHRSPAGNNYGGRAQNSPISLVFIHPSAWKVNSPKFALREFTESIYSYEKKMNQKERPN